VNEDAAFIVSTTLPMDRVLFLAGIAFVAFLWFLKKPGSPRILIVIGAATAALATIGAHYTEPGGIAYNDNLVAIERRPPSLPWLVFYFLEAGGRLTALLAFAWAALKDDGPAGTPE